MNPVPLDSETAAGSSPLHHFARAKRYFAAGQIAQGILSLEDAIALCPSFAEAWFLRGLVLEDGSPDTAYESFAQAVILTPGYSAAQQRLAAVAARTGRHTSILTPWVRAPRPTLRARIAQKLKRIAIRHDRLRYPRLVDEPTLRGLLLEEPGSPQLATVLGIILVGQRRVLEAEAFLRYALALAPWHGEAAVWLGEILRERPAAQAEIKSVLTGAISAGATDARLAPFALWTDLSVAAWDDYDGLLRQTLRSLTYEPLAATPLRALHFVDDPQLHKRCAASYCAVATEGCSVDASGQVPRRVWTGASYGHQRLRIAYVSSDFRNHVVGQFIAGVIERHDRAKVEVYGISHGVDDGSAMRRRLEKAFDRFIDVRGMSDASVAASMQNFEIDVAVDLNGYTEGERVRIFTHSPAPIQVGYLGYPGTLGGPMLDYVLADDVVVPPGEERFYTEKVVRLSGGFFPTDPELAISTPRPARQDCGLPHEGFVFACFNRVHKITPPAFDIWMRLLSKTPAAVLWLSNDNELVARNLRRAAEVRGVDPARLVFAARAPMQEHLARHACADLFLDTWPYNAHGTAAHALWAGLPLVTLSGRGFAARVSASLLAAAGLPELVARSAAEYEAIALRLATTPDETKVLREKLQRQRATCSLFDAEGLARRLERAYATMIARYRAGKAPTELVVQ